MYLIFEPHYYYYYYYAKEPSEKGASFMDSSSKIGKGMLRIEVK